MTIMSRVVPDAWAQISPYLDAVLDLDPGKRDAWVADLQRRLPRVADARADVSSMLERADRCLTKALAANHPLTAEARSLREL